MSMSKNPTESLFCGSFATGPWSLLLGAVVVVAPLVLLWLVFCLSEPRDR